MATRTNESGLTAVEAIVFDKDGTLINLHTRWAPWIAGVCHSVAAACDDSEARGLLEAALGVSGNHLVADSPAAVMTGGEIHQIAVDLMAERGHDRDAIASTVTTAFGASPVGDLVPLGNVAAVMTELNGRGIKLGIATSDDRANTRSELAQMGIAGLIEAIRCGDDPGPIKPDPRVLFLLAEELEVEPSRMIFVGDSLHDMGTAAAAAVRFVGVRGGSSRPAELDVGSRYLIADIGGLLEVIG